MWEGTSAPHIQTRVMNFGSFYTQTASPTRGNFACKYWQQSVENIGGQKAPPAAGVLA